MNARIRTSGSNTVGYCPSQIALSAHLCDTLGVSGGIADILAKQVYDNPGIEFNYGVGSVNLSIILPKPAPPPGTVVSIVTDKNTVLLCMVMDSIDYRRFYHAPITDGKVAIKPLVGAPWIVDVAVLIIVAPPNTPVAEHWIALHNSLVS